ncbi:MAG: ComEC/Rec2 family competence protein, partial [Hyphomicrobiaceae bacterium]
MGGGWLWSTVEGHADRLFLWVPVLFGLGVGIYFALPVEPRLTTLGALTASALVGGLLSRRTLPGIVLGGVVFWVSAGLLGAKVAGDISAAPVLGHRLTHVRVTGWVERVEPRDEGARRINVRVHDMRQRKPVRPHPFRVRIKVPASGPPLAPGDGVSVDATLLPPGRPALPGGYDFARSAWFMSLGGVGYTRRAPEIVAIDAPMPWSLVLWLPVERLRQRIGQRITAELAGETGGIAVALITGERGGISQETTDAYRKAGLVHILSISGLHMTVFAGSVFVMVRFLLALFPGLALRFPIKKWAAVAGLIGTVCYLLISGGSPPPVRSALMIGVMFIAILMDRPALALRNIAISALLILVIEPQSLIDVGFQMSFAAVTALVAAAEAYRDWRLGRGAERGRRHGGAIGYLILGFVGILTSTAIATAAVAPFAAYHFHSGTQYGALANLAAIPACNILVMPAALATLVAMPFGLEWLPLWIMGRGIDVMTWVAHFVSGLPGAAVALPEISRTSFLLMVAGGLWLVLWRRRVRLLGLLLILAGLAVAPARWVPDLMIDENGGLVA